LAIIGILAFGHYPTAFGTVGIVCSLSGGVWYAVESKRLPAPPAQRDPHKEETYYASPTTVVVVDQSPTMPKSI
jgi:hypothetical protein